MCVCGEMRKKMKKKKKKGERRVRGVNGEMNLKPEGDRPQKGKLTPFFINGYYFSSFFSSFFIFITYLPLFLFPFSDNSSTIFVGIIKNCLPPPLSLSLHFFLCVVILFQIIHLSNLLYFHFSVIHDILHVYVFN